MIMMMFDDIMFFCDNVISLGIVEIQKEAKGRKDKIFGKTNEFYKL